MNFEELMKKRPHVVILGAGASCAAIPNGDKNGKKISAMNGFIEKLGLSELLTKITLSTTSNNLEDIYMELDERSNREQDCVEIKVELEQKIFSYMAEYEIPDSPTIYDYLILSLTDKDLIATFNWDPLLIQAYCRVMQYTDNLPFLVYLHGNVAVGYCEKDNVMGNIGARCKCGNLLQPIKLLYPIKKKNYAEIDRIKTNYAALIAESEDEATISTLPLMAKAEMSAVRTAEQTTLESLQNAAQADVESYIDISLFAGDNKLLAENIILQAKEKIASAKNENEMNAIVATAKLQLDGLEKAPAPVPAPSAFASWGWIVLVSVLAAAVAVAVPVTFVFIRKKKGDKNEK